MKWARNSQRGGGQKTKDFNIGEAFQQVRALQSLKGMKTAAAQNQVVMVNPNWLASKQLLLCQGTLNDLSTDIQLTF